MSHRVGVTCLVAGFALAVIGDLHAAPERAQVNGHFFSALERDVPPAVDGGLPATTLRLYSGYRGRAGLSLGMLGEYRQALVAPLQSGVAGLTGGRGDGAAAEPLGAPSWSGNGGPQLGPGGLSIPSGSGFRLLFNAGVGVRYDSGDTRITLKLLSRSPGITVNIRF